MNLTPLDDDVDHAKQISNVCVVKINIVTLFIANVLQVGELTIHV